MWPKSVVVSCCPSKCPPPPLLLCLHLAVILIESTICLHSVLAEVLDNKEQLSTRHSIPNFVYLVNDTSHNLTTTTTTATTTTTSTFDIIELSGELGNDDLRNFGDEFGSVGKTSSLNESSNEVPLNGRRQFGKRAGRTRRENNEPKLEGQEQRRRRRRREKYDGNGRASQPEWPQLEFSSNYDWRASSSSSNHANVNANANANSNPNPNPNPIEARPTTQVRFQHQHQHHQMQTNYTLGHETIAQTVAAQVVPPSPIALEMENQTGTIRATFNRTRRKRMAQLAPPTHQQLMQQHKPVVGAIAGQRLIIPCRNYTLTQLNAPLDSQQQQQSTPRRVLATSASQHQLLLQMATARAGGVGGGNPLSSATTTTTTGSSGAANSWPAYNLIVPQTSGISLIVWHKDDQLNSPIFAADARGAGSLKGAKQQVIAETLSGRARLELIDLAGKLVTFEQGALPALVIEDAKLLDAGLYTCTVEFYKAPTQTYQARASVSDPPKNMIFRDETTPGASQRLYSSLAGPYDEDSRLVLVCEVDQGQPSAGHVSWWQLDSVTQLTSGGSGGGGGVDSINGNIGSSRKQAAATSNNNHPRQQQHQQQWLAFDDKVEYITTISLDFNDGLLASSTAAAAAAAAAAATDHNLLLDNGGDSGLRSGGQAALLAADGGIGHELFVGAHSHNLSSQSVLGSVGGVGGSLNYAAAAAATAVAQFRSQLRGAHQARRLKHWRRVHNRTSATLPSSETAGKLQAFLELDQLSRANLGEEFMCLAANSGDHHSPPLNASISLNLNLKPVEVRIVDKSNHTFKLGQKTIIECHVLGSKPSATIKWFRGQQEIETTPTPTSGSGSAGSGSLPFTGQEDQADSLAPEEGGVTDQQQQQQQQQQQTSFLVSEFNRDINNLTKISYLTLIPQLSDNQQQLTCSAHNSKMASATNGPPPAPVLSDSIVMNVQFAPKLALQFGASIKQDSIQPGSDIFMDCSIESNPQFNDLIWLHNGNQLVANISAGIIMSNQSLVLRNISIEQRGAYQCLAHNLLGRTVSNKLELKLKFAPICDYSLTKTRHEIALNQPTRIECHVLAEPSDDLHFTWRFNSSSSSSSSSAATRTTLTSQDSSNNNNNNADDADADSSTDSLSYLINVDLQQYETNYTKSSVIFTPKTRRHFGQLACFASNSMGKQDRPCTIQIVHSELPEPVLGCFIDNQTHSSFSIHCQPSTLAPLSGGGGGGATTSAAASKPASGQTYFILELYANETTTAPASNVQSSSSTSGGGQDRQERQQHTDSAMASTHLRLRQQELSASGANNQQLNHNSMNDEDYFATSGQVSNGYDSENQAAYDDEQQQQQQQVQYRARVKRLLSESPSFNVLDLKPNSSYNILVYVQNSKGRSPATHHQVSTRPLDPTTLASSSAANGAGTTTAGQRVELLLNGSGGGGSGALAQPETDGADSFGRKIMSYFSLIGANNHNQNDNGQSSSSAPTIKRNTRHPLVGVTLIVLLITITILTVAFFASRVLCKQRTRQRHRRRVASTSNASRPSGLVDLCDSKDDSGEFADDGACREAAARYLKRQSRDEMRAKGGGGGGGGGGGEQLVKRGASNDPMSCAELAARQLISSQSSSLTATSTSATQRQAATNRARLTGSGSILTTSLSNCGTGGGGSSGAGAAAAAAKGATKSCSSGSDTSHETNTGSTYVSTPRTGSQTTPTANDSCSQQQQQQQQQQLQRSYNTMSSVGGNVQRRYSRDDLNGTNLVGPAAHSYSFASLQKGPPSRCSSSQQQQQQQQLVRGNLQPQQHQYQQQQPFRGPLQCRDSGDQLNTPQMSVHSSECSSNNVDNSVDIMSAAHSHQHQHQQLYRNQFQAAASAAAAPVKQPRHSFLIEYPNDGFSSVDTSQAVYVINNDQLQHNTQDLDLNNLGYHLDGSPPTCLVGPSGDLWNSGRPASELSGGINHAQLIVNRCHLVNDPGDNEHDADDDLELPLNVQTMAHLNGRGNGGGGGGSVGNGTMLPNSFSIPISLSDRLEVLARSNSSSNADRFRSPLDHLNHLLVGGGGGGAGDHHDQLLASSAINDMGQHSYHQPVDIGQSLQLTPPVDFATDYRSCLEQDFRLANLVSNTNQQQELELEQQQQQQQQQQLGQKHRVKFETTASLSSGQRGGAAVE